MFEIASKIRELINQPRVNFLVRQHLADWNQLTSALDTIEDSELAIQAFGSTGARVSEPETVPLYPLIAGAQYLTTYGLLQALFIQQDAVFHLGEALGFTHDLANYPDLVTIREIRNMSIGHPTKLDRPKSKPTSHHFISRATMGLVGFQILSFSDDGAYSSREVSFAKLVADQRNGLSGILANVLQELEKREEAHVEEFSEERL